jgi:hypothetical protein
VRVFCPASDDQTHTMLHESDVFCPQDLQVYNSERVNKSFVLLYQIVRMHAVNERG